MKPLTLVGTMVVCALLGAVSEGLFLYLTHDCTGNIYIENSEVNISVPDLGLVPEEPTGAAQNVSYEPITTLPPVDIPLPPIDPYDDQGFFKKFQTFRPIIDIRKDNFGIGHSRKIVITYHEGGQRLDYKDLRKTVRAVLQRMPNLRTTDHLVDLCMETMKTETDMGGEKVSTGIKKWKNYGIAQFREDTAIETLDWLKTVRPDVYDQVMNFHDDDKDLIWNLSYNVPFSVALMAQYYWRRVPDIYKHISTMEKRAELWKAIYNSPKGKGTVRCYIKRNK